jgi:hypothetical protein
MGIRERERIFENVARLTQAEKKAYSSDVAIVREDLEAQLGGTVSRAMAARVLGVSHTALNNWVALGGVPVVIGKGGRKEIPIPALLELKEKVDEQRRSGRRRSHVIEPVIAKARRRAERMRPTIPAGGRDFTDPHRKAELRGLAYHRALAPRLRRPMIEAAARKLERWKQEGRVDPRHAEIWEQTLALPMTEIRKAITADDDHGRDLRQNSPLAGLLSEPERRKILEAIS